MASGLLEAGIAAGASLIGTGIQAGATSKMNKKTRKWNEKMYGIQRADRLADWNMQNEYNSPEAQMQRLREAGLNPNLVYAKGADNTAAPVSETDVKGWNPDIADYAGGISSAATTGIQSYQNARLNDAQVDNLRVQNTVSLQDAALKAAQIANTQQSTARSKFDLDLASELKQTSMDFARENLRKTMADTAFQISENERRSVMQSSNLKEAATRILQMRAQTAKTAEERSLLRAQEENVRSNTRLNALDADLKKNGIMPTDPLYMRVLGRLLGTEDTTLRDKIKDFSTIKENSVLGKTRSYLRSKNIRGASGSY